MNTIELLDRSEISSIKLLLHKFGLPDSDLETAPIQFFGIKENDKLIATGALEIYGFSAVLRSVGVRQKYRNLGYGNHIINFLEKKAIEMGIQKLFLLTTTAEVFFRKLNYNPIHRDLCPNEIKSSAQFKDICPTTARCLFKIL